MQDRRNFAGDVFCPQLSKGYPQWLSKPRRWPQRVQAEPKTLVGLGSIAGLLLLLAKIVEDVIEKESGTFDRTILLAFRLPGHASQPIGPAWLTSAFRDVTSLGGPTIITLIMVIAVAYLFVDVRNRLAVLVAISIASGAIAEKLMKLGFDRARPDVVPHLTTVHSPSFPSDHAMLSAITYLTLGALLARAQSHWRNKIFILFTGILITLLIGPASTGRPTCWQAGRSDRSGRSYFGS
jgi:undecaprenyl-diphosphatase